MSKWSPFQCGDAFRAVRPGNERPRSYVVVEALGDEITYREFWREPGKIGPYRASPLYLDRVADVDIRERIDPPDGYTLSGNARRQLG